MEGILHIPSNPTGLARRGQVWASRVFGLEVLVEKLCRPQPKARQHHSACPENHCWNISTHPHRLRVSSSTESWSWSWPPSCSRGSGSYVGAGVVVRAGGALLEPQHRLASPDWAAASRSKHISSSRSSSGSCGSKVAVVAAA